MGSACLGIGFEQLKTGFEGLEIGSKTKGLEMRFESWGMGF